VALSRNEGEKAAKIQVRGSTDLSPACACNGMEAMSTVRERQPGRHHRGRAFDFNVFASDLCQRHHGAQKSASAISKKGSLGAEPCVSAQPAILSTMTASRSRSSPAPPPWPGQAGSPRRTGLQPARFGSDLFRQDRGSATNRAPCAFLVQGRSRPSAESRVTIQVSSNRAASARKRYDTAGRDQGCVRCAKPRSRELERD